MRWYAIPLAAVMTTVAAAQQIEPHVGYVFPAGGRQGTTFEVTVGGQFLDGANNAYITGAGVQAMIVDRFKPLSQGQFNRLREELEELNAKRKAATPPARKRAADDAAAAAKKVEWTEADQKKIDELLKKMATLIRRPATPAIVESVKLQVTIAPDAAPGERELRLATPIGMTNPLVFRIGQLPEYSEKPAKPVDELAPQRPRFMRGQPADEQPTGPAAVTIPAVINGQITAGSVDRYKFQASNGQKLVIAAAARELIPYISDAVPGWFQATMALHDAKGREVSYSDSFRFHPDPVLYYEIQEEGEYTLAIKDSIYRGREDFVYRITVGEVPFVTGIFPLGGKVGSNTAVEVRGWNLPAGRISADTREKGIQLLSVTKGEWTSNRIPFLVDTLPERTEEERHNNQIKGAPSLKLPIIVNGRIDRAGDIDVIRFDGKAGDEIVAEVHARRLDSPLDSVLRLTDAAGNPIAINDDHEDKGAALLTHHADSVIRARLPKNGAYYLHIADTQRKGGPEYGYRLRISRPQPDFELRVVPSNINARPGMSMPITVYALRRDGFTGDIALKLKDAPEGFVLNGGWIPGNQEKVRMTLTVPPSRIEKPRPMTLEGRASIGGKEVRRLAVPAEDMMQAFAYRHLVASQEWLVRVTGQGRARGPWKVSASSPVRLPSGGTAPVKLSVPAQRIGDGELKFTLNQPPEGITIQEVSDGRDGVAIVFRAEPGKAKPGLKGNLIVDAWWERVGDAKANANRRRQPLGTLPAIPFEVVGL